MRERQIGYVNLNLRAGEWVEVRHRDEIVATLDEDGCVDHLPFMPEMFQYCGRRFKVFKRADKTCDNIGSWSIRRLTNTVHLDGLRCDGSSHDRCQAGCLIFWKEVWLKRADEPLIALPVGTDAPSDSSCSRLERCSATRVAAPDGEMVYTCQATELRKFTCAMAWWDPRQYFRDYRSGNLPLGSVDDSKTAKLLEITLMFLEVLRTIIVSVFREGRRIDYPAIRGPLVKTSLEKLDLQPGELVQVRSKEEIITTLDKNNRNRGLLFDSEMLRYCGGIYRVLRRVDHIIDEKTGKMIDMKNPCIVLEGVYCLSDYHRFCPRAIYSYWRENWLQRLAFANPSDIDKGVGLEPYHTVDRY